MNHLQDHITRLKTDLTEFIQEAKPYLDKKLYEEKNVQLHSIERTINQMQKSNTAVPDELRNLKIRLISELATIRDLQKEVVEMQKMFHALIPSKEKLVKNPKKAASKIVRKQIKEHSLVTISGIIKAGIIEAPFTLVKKYKDEVFRSVVSKEGVIELLLNGEKQYFNSPSSAAVAATEKAQNGWTWWFVEKDSENIILDSYRKKLKQL